MNKPALAIFAFTLTTAAIIPSSSATEAQHADDTYTTLSDRQRIVPAVPIHTKVTYTERSTTAIRSATAPSGQAPTTKPPESRVPAPDTEPTVSTPEFEPERTSAKKDETAPEPNPAQETKSVSQPRTPSAKPQTSSLTVPDEAVQSVDTEASAADFLSALAVAIHQQTNDERERAGLLPLQRDYALATIAKNYSADMAENNHFSHVRKDGCDLSCRFAEAGYDAEIWGENLAWRSADTQSEVSEVADYVMEQWMQSTGHRRNILSDTFTHHSIGLTYLGDKVYVTVNFANPR